MSPTVITWAVIAVIAVVAWPAILRYWRMKAWLGLVGIAVAGYMFLLVIDTYAIRAFGHGG